MFFVKKYIFIIKNNVLNNILHNETKESYKTHRV